MFPVILYDINKNQIITDTIVVVGNTFYLYSPNIFTIEIIQNKNYNACIYSVHVNNGRITTLKEDKFSDNFGYTIAFNIDNKYEYGLTDSIDIRVSNDTGYSKDYRVILVEENKLPAHYNDIITNNYLPTLDELTPAIVKKQFSDNKRELVKRLLLDFKNILKSKGTINSISKFFQFIGFNKKQIEIFEEYFVLDANENVIKTTYTPDKISDVKSGNYSVIYDNKVKDESNLLDKKNLPIIKFTTENIKELLECLRYAIPLANKYFTAVEQDINFFGIKFSSNVHQLFSVTSSFNQIFVSDVFSFRKNINISFSTKQMFPTINDEGFPFEKQVNHMIVENCLQKNTDVYKTEIKYFGPKSNQNLYEIDRELNDVDIEEENIQKFSRTFGVCINGTIVSPNTYVGYRIYSERDKSVVKASPVFCHNEISVSYITKNTGTYFIEVTVIDTYGNREVYKYKYIVNNSKARINFDIYSTLNLDEDFLDIHNINLDTSSGTIITTGNSKNKNFILGLNTIPESLTDYFNVSADNTARYLTDASTHRRNGNAANSSPLYFVESINKNIKVKDCTEVQLQFTEQFFEFCIIEDYDENEILDLINDSIGEFNNSNYEALSFNKLFACKLSISDDSESETKEVLFLSSTETGINLKYLYPKLFENQKIHRIPVNYDFPLFSNVLTDGVIYQPDECYSIELESLSFPVVRAFFPRMDELVVTEVKQGDTVLIRINSNYIVDEVNVVWTIKNSFTGEVLLTTNDYALKYRINEACSYDVTVEFDIYDNHYVINKPGIFTSYKIQD